MMAADLCDWVTLKWPVQDSDVSFVSDWISAHAADAKTLGKPVRP